MAFCCSELVVVDESSVDDDAVVASCNCKCSEPPKGNVWPVCVNIVDLGDDVNDQAGDSYCGE